MLDPNPDHILRLLERFVARFSWVLWSPGGLPHNPELIERMRSAGIAVAKRVRRWNQAYYARGDWDQLSDPGQTSGVPAPGVERPSLPSWDYDDEETALGLLAGAHEFQRGDPAKFRIADCPPPIFDLRDEEQAAAQRTLAGLFLGSHLAGRDLVEEYRLVARLYWVMRPGWVLRVARSRFWWALEEYQKGGEMIPAKSLREIWLAKTWQDLPGPAKPFNKGAIERTLDAAPDDLLRRLDDGSNSAGSDTP